MTLTTFCQLKNPHLYSRMSSELNVTFAFVKDFQILNTCVTSLVYGITLQKCHLNYSRDFQTGSIASVEQSTPTSNIPSLGDIADRGKDRFLPSLYLLFQISLITFKFAVLFRKDSSISLKKKRYLLIMIYHSYIPRNKLGIIIP